MTTTLLLGGTLTAQDTFQVGTTVTLELQNGDRLTGILESADGPQLVLSHEMFGRLSIPRAWLKIQAPPPVIEPVSPWTRKFDVALSGSGGNTETENFRIGLDAKHDTKELADMYTIWWRRAESNQIVSEEKGFAQMRREWKREGSKWRPFAQASFETDKFADFDARVAVAGGGAYQFKEGPEHAVSGRVGAGVSKKMDPNTPTTRETNYEALLGIDWNWTIDEMSQFLLVSDLYPSLSDSGEARSVTRLAWERKVSDASPWYVKAGLDFFWDSVPGAGKSSSDTNFYVGLGRSF
ncbi:MAG: DUF481 domain-containing protein [Planctomycetota bacterium]